MAGRALDRPSRRERRQRRARPRRGRRAPLDRRSRRATWTFRFSQLGGQPGVAPRPLVRCDAGRHRPDVVLSSPYVRAPTTAGSSRPPPSFGPTASRVRRRRAAARARVRHPRRAHARRRLQKYPDQYELKQAIGSFSVPTGRAEPGRDVILLLGRQVDDDLRAAIGAASLPPALSRGSVLGFRAVPLPPAHDGRTRSSRSTARGVANCSVTTYAYDPTIGPWVEWFFAVSTSSPRPKPRHAVTTAKDAPSAPK